MFTAEEKKILINGLDMQVFAISQTIGNTQDENQKVIARQTINLVQALITKVEAVKVKEEK